MSAMATISADPLGILVAFGAGMLSFLSPCVLPLVPGYVSMVSGLSAADLENTDKRDLRPVLVGIGGVRPRVHARLHRSRRHGLGAREDSRRARAHVRDRLGRGHRPARAVARRNRDAGAVQS